MWSEGYVFLTTGIAVGIIEVASGLAIGLLGGLTSMADAQNPQLFVRMLLVQVFASVIGLFGLLFGILQMNAHFASSSMFLQTLSQTELFRRLDL